ncbi:MAG: hybrid sensor histidine kinase/response regulator [Chloroflexota bacterium]
MTNSGQSTHPYRILVIEDDVMLGEVIRDALKESYIVTLLEEGSRVVDILRNEPFDLVLLDIMLPDVHGLDLLQGIREDHSADDLVVIIMSALDDANTIVDGFEYGANDYIVKPVELSVMFARISTQLRLLELQRERKDYIEHLERGELLRKQLNQIASHDLKNPINNLRIAEGLLREELSKSKNLRLILNTIDVSLDMMEQIVESFLDVVAIQTNSIALKTDYVLMQDVINNALAQYELAADKKNITMMIGSSDGIVLADSGRMAQIAGNLVSNAVKYSPRGSNVHVWSEIIGDVVRLSVADSGKGVPESERHLLFTEFGQLSTRPTGGEGSTGLGLWIVKHLIELQNGIAGVDFPDTGGSIFWIELPLANPNA